MIIALLICSLIAHILLFIFCFNNYRVKNNFAQRVIDHITFEIEKSFKENKHEDFNCKFRGKIN